VPRCLTDFGLPGPVAKLLYANQDVQQRLEEAEALRVACTSNGDARTSRTECDPSGVGRKCILLAVLSSVRSMGCDPPEGVHHRQGMMFRGAAPMITMSGRIAPVR
jgi:hypothetical protein